MKENLTYVKVKNIPSSAKIKSRQISYNLSFGKVNNIYQRNRQGKIKTFKDKLIEENNNNKKSITLNNNNYQIENENNTKHFSKINREERKTFSYIISTINRNKTEKNLVKNHYNNNVRENNEKNSKKIGNEKNFNNFIKVNKMNLESNEQQKNYIKDKENITVKNKKEDSVFANNIGNNNMANNNTNNKTSFLLYKHNSNNWRNQKIVQENINSEIKYNNTFYNKNSNNNKSDYFSFLSGNETSKNNENSGNFQTTSKIEGKTKKIYKEEYFKNKDFKNNNEYDFEKIKIEKNCNKTLIDFYIRKKIDNITQINLKSNNNYNKNIFAKPQLNNNINAKKNNGNSNDNNNDEKWKQNNNKLYINKNINNSKYIEHQNNYNILNNTTDSTKNENIKIKTSNRLFNSLNQKLRTQFFLENEVNDNIIPNKILNSKLNNYKIFQETSDNIKINNQHNSQNIFINNSKNIYIQNYNINENLNNTYNNNESRQSTSKNYSFDLTKSYQNKKMNGIKYLKNNLPSRKNGSNEKIITLNIKDVLYDNKKTSDKKSSDETEIININSDTTIEKNKENEKTLYEETIIDNDNDVYTLTKRNSINKNNIEKGNINKEVKNNVIKEKNKDNNINNKQDILISNTYNNNNLIETITIKYSDNPNNDENKYRKPIAELINEQNKINKRNNLNNSLYFKNYFKITNPGQNYGIRKTNQDTPVAYISLNGIKGFNIFGVLDGHGVDGHHVSRFLSEYLIKKIISHREIIKIRDLNKIYQTLRKSNYEILTSIFYSCDKIIGQQDFDVTFSGTTCILVIQIGKNLICANVGDSRAILIYDKFNEKDLSHAEIFELSHDCKPDLPEEKKRILQMGGIVDQMLDINGLKAGPQRVWAKNKNFPGLAMSRSLGDYKGKQCGIIPLPEFIEYKLDRKSKYMVICSDGVWEFLSNKNVMEMGNDFYLKKDIIGFTQQLIKQSENLWEKQDVVVDDITAVVVFF